MRILPRNAPGKTGIIKKNALFVYKGDFFIIIADVDADRWQSGLMHRS